MILVFKFGDADTFDPDEIQKRAKELLNVIETEVKNHFGNSKGSVTVSGKRPTENGDFVEVELLAEDFVKDLEKAKNRMYDNRKHFMEDFISDVQEYCSYGGIVVTARG